ncbi:MAG: hypothetical protein K6G66_03460 [Oscillospiraceae bacterium]|nr:hypothetical protein [Oscillospiraceae bacterium]
MKKYITSIFSLLLCCALLCACGGKQAETVHLPAPTEVPTASPAPTPASPVLPESDQRALIERSRSVWLPEGLEYETWYQAVTDLDRNGRLEVLTASLQGSGLYTYVNCWEVSEQGTALVQCPDNTGEGEAWPDIIKDRLTGYRDPASGRMTYVCEDVTRDGAAHYLTSKKSFCLDRGQITLQVLATMDEVYTTETVSMKNYYDGSDAPITEQEYNSAEERTFAGQEQGELTLTWTQLEAQPSPPQITAQPQITVPPQYAQPQSGGPVTITKNPTSESIAAGGKTWFIAHANNASSLTWLFTSPQGQLYDLRQAMQANPGLQLQELEQDTLAVSNVPVSFDGWSIQARFDGPGGSATTSPAMIYVDDYVTAYGPVLSNYYYAYTNGVADPAFAYERGISEYITYSNHAGYALQDLNGDGTPELIIAGMGDGNNSNGVIYEIDTLVNGQPVQIACSSARDRYLLRTDGTVLNEGSGGAGHSAYVLNSVAEDGLVPAESVFTYFDGQPNDGYYHARDGYRYEPTSYDEYLTEQEFNYFVGAWEDSVYIPQLTMIA